MNQQLLMSMSQAVAWTPASLFPAVWLKDTGASVGTWPDESGNSYNGTQADSARQPAIIANSINGRQIRRFDGGDSLNLVAPVAAKTQNFSVFMLIKPASQSQIIKTLLDFDHSSAPNNGWVIQSENANSGRHYYLAWYDGTNFQPLGNFGAGNGIQVTQDAAQVIAFIKSGTSIIGYKSNAAAWAPAAASSSTVVHLSGRTMELGDTKTPSRAIQADIGEVLIFPTALTSAQRKDVESYLATRWGTPAPVLWTPAYLQQPPTAWFDALTLSASFADGAAVTSYTDSAGRAFAPWHSSVTPTGGVMKYNTTPGGKPSVAINLFGGIGGWKSTTAAPAQNVSIFALWKRTGTGVLKSYFTTYGNDPYNSRGSYMCGEGTGAGAPLFFNKNLTTTAFVYGTTAAVVDTLDDWVIMAGGLNPDGVSVWGEKNGANILSFPANTGNSTVNQLVEWSIYRGALGTTYANTYEPTGYLCSEIILPYKPDAAEREQIRSWMINRYL